jgi:hypothetical protein
MSKLIHTECRANAEAYFAGDPTGPPDPDRWGNRRWLYRCPVCGHRGSVLTDQSGGSQAPPGFAFEADIDWTVPLEG